MESASATEDTHIHVILNSETKANLENLQGFARSRKAIDQIARKVLPQKYMDQYPSFSKSETLCQKTDDLNELLSRCKSVLFQFHGLLVNIAKETSLNPDVIAMWKGKKVMLTKDVPYKCLTVAKLKSMERCTEKIKNEYGGDSSKILDILRASFVVNTEEQLIAVAKALSGLNVVRIKNRTCSFVVLAVLFF